MKRFFFVYLSAFLFFRIVTYSDIPPGYYDSANGLTGDELKAALHDIIKDHNVQTYSSIWTHFQTTDVKPNGKVWDIYSDIPGSTPPYEYTFVTDQCGSYSAEGDCYNREHSWPKSWFDDASPMDTDLFLIYPTDGYVNGKRSNYPYAEISSPTWTSLNGSKLGLCSYPGYTGTVFEPIDEYKGDFARTYFYFSVRYYTEDTGWTGSDMTVGAELEPWAVDLLRDWHVNDPVSQKDIDRNEAVYGIQNNRNPFIDHPAWVCEIWGGSCGIDTTPPSFAGLQSANTTGISGEVQLSWNSASDTSIPIIYNIYISTSSGSQNFSSIDYSTTELTYIINGLSNGITSYFVVRAEDSANNEDLNTVEKNCVPTDPAQAPVLQSAVPGDKIVFVNWSSVAGSDEYRLYFSNTGGGPYSILISTYLTSYIHKGLTNGMTYYYVVKNYDAEKYPALSEYSNQLSAIPSSLVTANTVTVNPESLAPEFVGKGDKDIPFEKLELYTNSETATLSSIKFDLIGTSEEGDIIGIKVYLDNGDDNFSVTDDILIGTALFSLKTASIDIIDQVICSTETVYFICLDISSNASDGHIAGLRCNNSSYFSLDLPDSVSEQNFPFESGLSEITSSSEDLSPVIVYPNPYKPDTIRNEIVFANLREGTEIGIYSISGEKMKISGKIYTSEWTWNLQNSNSKDVSSGIYFYFIKNDKGETKIGKIAVIR